MDTNSITNIIIDGQDTIVNNIDVIIDNTYMVDPYRVDHLDIVEDLEYLHKELLDKVVVLDYKTFF
jgi:hypothetical protein